MWETAGYREALKAGSIILNGQATLTPQNDHGMTLILTSSDTNSFLKGLLKRGLLYFKPPL